MLQMIQKLIRKRKNIISEENKKLFSPLVLVNKEEIEQHLTEAWRAPVIPKRQYNLFVEEQLKDYRQGLPVEPFDVLVNILKDNIDRLEHLKILEIGCSSGYYSEVLKIKGINSKYYGCDYSGYFIESAQKLFPGIEFQVQDASSLTYADGSFDIVVSGCCLLHIMDYETAIKETARVAKDYIVFHRTPVLHKKATSYFIKTAYGVKMFEIHFNERELLRLMNKNNLRLVDIITFNATFEDSIGDFHAYKTYLCRKI